MEQLKAKPKPCVIHDWSCVYHSCMTDECQMVFCHDMLPYWGAGKCFNHEPADEPIITVLRAQHDARKGGDKQWKIAKKTDAPGGGWASASKDWYASREEAELEIERLINIYPHTKKE